MLIVETRPAVAASIAEDIFPGSDYVDWVGIDGYNSVWGWWWTPDQVFDGMVHRLGAIAPSKPLGITKVGCSTVSSTPSAKAQWVTSYFSWLRAPRVER